MSQTIIRSLALVAVIGCAEPFAIIDDAEAFHASIGGIVRDASGATVSGSRIVVERQFYCIGSSRSLTYATSAVNGRFAMVLERVNDPRPADCIRIHAEPPSGSALRRSDVWIDTLRYAAGLPPKDTVMVELTLPN